MPRKALEKAISLFSSKTEFAIRLRTNRRNIYNWLAQGLPAEWVLRIEKATQGRVTRHELRPDIYPMEK